MPERVPAEVFPPGEFVKDELEARGWSQADLAEILGRPPRLVSEIVTGKRSVTPETARGLAAAFSTEPQLWMNLESAYQLSRVQPVADAVQRRARLYGLVPLKEMLRRHWLEPTDNVAVLEEHVKAFLGTDSLEKPMSLKGAAARSPIGPTAAQSVWLARCQQLGRLVQAARFTNSKLDVLDAKLKELLHSTQEIRHVPRILADAGIRFVVVEALPQSRIDGACFWLDSKSPAISLSLRFDRIDAFWFTLLHEVSHVRNGDGISDARIDVDLVGEHGKPTEQKSIERRANDFAAEFLVSTREIDDFVARVRPLYSKQKIVGFANRINVHPGIVVGQLQHRGEIPYTHSREMLDKVRNVLIPAAMTDGWGSIVSKRRESR